MSDVNASVSANMNVFSSIVTYFSKNLPATLCSIKYVVILLSKSLKHGFFIGIVFIPMKSTLSNR